jgi:hypothetical protein
MEREAAIGEPNRNSTVSSLMDSWIDSATSKLERRGRDLRRGAVLIEEFGGSREEASQPRDYRSRRKVEKMGNSFSRE